MEIRRKFNKSVEYRMISRGDCFTLSDKIDDIYMKISSIEDSDCREWNAVRLCDGDVTVFHELQEVIPISGVFEID
nr:MAG TPA: hypothetical protein [Caudoviricetes sp.]